MSVLPTRPVVLLVEDSEDDAFFFRRALKRCGIPCSFFEVNDGGAAIAYLKAAQGTPEDPKHRWPDLIFLDLKLPTFSGFEVLSWIREQKFAVSPDITILSGSEHKSDMERALSLGASGYLVKPLLAERLHDRMEEWLDRHAEESIAAEPRPTGT